MELYKDIVNSAILKEYLCKCIETVIDKSYITTNSDYLYVDYDRIKVTYALENDHVKYLIGFSYKEQYYRVEYVKKNVLIPSLEIDPNIIPRSRQGNIIGIIQKYESGKQITPGDINLFFSILNNIDVGLLRGPITYIQRYKFTNRSKYMLHGEALTSKVADSRNEVARLKRSLEHAEKKLAESIANKKDFNKSIQNKTK